MSDDIRYLHDIGMSTKRGDNTLEERRKAMIALIAQSQAHTWHPPLKTPYQDVEDMMDMLGIEPEWLMTDEAPKFVNEHGRAVPHSIVQRIFR